MFILFDIGKTKTRIAASNDLSAFDQPVIFDTPKNYEAAIELITLKAIEVAKGDAINLIGGGVAGPLTKDKQSLAEDINFPGWGGKPICGDLWTHLGANVYLENDAALCGLGEAEYGSGRNAKIVAYITISTGVGGVRIVDKQVDVTAMGFEPGWQVISADGKYAQDLLSGAAVEKQLGKKPYEITSLEFWDEKAKVLAYFLNNITVMWSPDVIVVGGSMMKEVGISVPMTEKYLKDILKIFPLPPILRKAALGDIGGIYGAMEFLKGKR